MHATRVGCEGWSRTSDLLLNGAGLCRLSYLAFVFPPVVHHQHNVAWIQIGRDVHTLPPPSAERVLGEDGSVVCRLDTQPHRPATGRAALVCGTPPVDFAPAADEIGVDLAVRRLHGPDRGIHSASPPICRDVTDLHQLVDAAGLVNLLDHGSGSLVYSDGCAGVTQQHLERLVALVRAAERERIAQMFDVPGHIHGEAEEWSRAAAARIREAAKDPR